MFITILDNLISEKGITRKKLLEDLQLGKNNIKNWEKNNTIPNKVTLEAISDYFGVSVDYLLGKTDIKAKSPLLQKIEQKRKTSCFVLDYHSETGEPEVIDIAPENMEKVKEYIRLLNNDKK